MREQIKSDVPLLWKQRAEAGLCPVCGKTKEEFDKRMIVYCSKKCRDKYASKYTWWNRIKEEVLERDQRKCAKCKITEDKRDKEFKEKKQAIFEKYIQDNKKKIESIRDKELVDLSKEYEERYDMIMDDKWIFEHRLSWEERDKLTKDIPDEYIEFEVDHIIPIAIGGDMWNKKNLQVLCKDCHKKKTKKDMGKIASKNRIKKTMVDGQIKLKHQNQDLETH